MLMHFTLCCVLLLNLLAPASGEFSVQLLEMPPTLYLQFDREHQLTVWAGIQSDMNSPVTLEIWTGWEPDSLELAITLNPSPPFPTKASIVMTVNFEGHLKLRAVLKAPPDGSYPEASSDHVIFVRRLEAPKSFQSANAFRGNYLEYVPTTDAHIVNLVHYAAEEYAGTERVQYDAVVGAFKIQYTPAVERYWMTVRCKGGRGGYFSFSMLREERESDGAILLVLQSAHAVHTRVWADSPPRPFPLWAQEGLCAREEPRIDEGLAPWEEEGVRVSKAAVENLIKHPTKVCWQRIQVVNNSLYVEQPELDRMGFEAFSERHQEKWYTVVLVETLLHVLQRFAVPDVDICVSEEVPQVLKGENLPSFAMTVSSAHMDILVPDFFFRYWDPEVTIPHMWYKPPIDRSLYAATQAPPWSERIPRLWWRGTVSSWFQSARGRLVRLAAAHPHLIDAKPLRVVGKASEESWEGLQELLQEMQVQVEGKGQVTDPHEVHKFKFVISTHGPHNHWSNRFRSLLSTGALVFKQEGTLEEFWEYELQPWRHFIPVSPSLHDLVEKVEWAVENDEEAAAIAAAGFEFVRERLRVTRVSCYWAHVLHRYGALLDYVPTPSENAMRYANINAFL